jgi:hypothetical protein
MIVILLVPLLPQTWLDEGTVLSGWGDGFIRAYKAVTADLAWAIPNAHRAPGDDYADSRLGLREKRSEFPECRVGSIAECGRKSRS